MFPSIKFSLLPLLAVQFLLSACSSTPDNHYYETASAEEVIALVKAEVSDFDGAVKVSGPAVVTQAQGQIIAQQAYLQSKLDVQGKTVAHQLIIKMNYRVPTAGVATWSHFDRARLNVGSLIQANSLNRETLACDEDGCLYREVLAINLSRAELRLASRQGLQTTLFSDAGRSQRVSIPVNYVKPYIAAINRTLAPRGLVHARLNDVHSSAGQNKYARGFAKAEAMARSLECKHETLKTLSADGPVSIFQVECPGERFSLIKCQWGNCQVVE